LATPRQIEPNEDPVCGMTVDVDAARERGLTLTHDGHEYAFCGKGCMLEFRDDPDTYLDPRYLPSM
jgi:YHS domain-containing protein